MLLRDDLAVGVAGDFPDRVIKKMLAVRGEPTDDVLKALRSDDRCDYVVASLDPIRIWRVRHGEAEECDLAHRTFVGDRAAFGRFQDLCAGWIPADSQAVKMRAAMDQLVSPFGGLPSVGGFATAVTSRGGKFRFLPKEFYIAGDSLFDGYHGLQLPGADTTPGANAIYIPRARAGRVFPHEDPSAGLKITAATVEEFAEVAQRTLAQTVTPFAGGLFFST